MKSGAPLTICPSDSILRVHVGDVIDFAFDARISGSPNRILTIAYIRGAPDDFLMPGVERMTLAEMRSLAALPPTDTVMVTAIPAASAGAVSVLAAALLGALVFLARTRQRRLWRPFRRSPHDSAQDSVTRFAGVQPDRTSLTGGRAARPTPGPPPGLCGTCRHARQIETRSGAVYRRCERSASDSRYRRYPVLPMLSCPGFEPPVTATAG